MPRSHVLHFRIAGMDCADEIADLRQAVGRLVGGDARLSFDLLNRRLTVDVGSGIFVNAARRRSRPGDQDE